MARDDTKRNASDNASNRGPKVESANDTRKNAPPREENKAMIAKVNQQMASEEDDSLVARVIGLGLIILGIIFIVLAVIVVILSRREPQVDTSIDRPTISTESEYVGEDTIKLSGTGASGSEIIFWVNEDLQEDSVEVEDGEFEYDVTVTEEGEYKIEAAAVEGFPIRKRSEKTAPLLVTVDWTRPSDDVTLEYSETSEDGTFELKGVTEPFATVILRDKETDEEYSVQADKDGAFMFEGIELTADSTEFEVIIRDRAGNERVLEKTIVVTRGTTGGTGTGTGTGGSTTGGNLPESAGELEAALQFLLGNKLMVFFGLAALVVFATNGGYVAMKLRKQ